MQTMQGAAPLNFVICNKNGLMIKIKFLMSSERY
jgi:hypothetical protein